MIYGQSNHPVLIKKIKLNVWSLKDEIKCVIAKKLKKTDNPDEKAKLKIIEEVTLKYTPGNTSDAPKLEIVQDVPEEKTDGESEETKEETTDESTPENKDENKDAESKENSEENKESVDGKAEATSDQDKKDDDDDDDETAEKSVFRLKPKLNDEQIKKGIMILSDVNMQDITFFVSGPFTPGQSIVIEFDVPNSFIVSAEILSCRRYNMKSKIISEVRPPYRIYALFQFMLPGERTKLREFVASIQPEIPKESAKKKVVEKEEAGDEEDEFADLGL